MNSTVQSLVVYLIVAFAAAFSIWRLLPRSAKKRLASGVQNSTLMPKFLRDRSAKVLTAESGCGSGCADCGPSPKTPGGVKQQPIRFVAKQK